ncbi:MAG: hypothetical protein E7015_03410 [Alphaproteobacteria bacterium]|nr:hypothetical protein [Alphaproteobacteria bacterium]
MRSVVSLVLYGSLGLCAISHSLANVQQSKNDQIEHQQKSEGTKKDGDIIFQAVVDSKKENKHENIIPLLSIEAPNVIDLDSAERKSSEQLQNEK